MPEQQASDAGLMDLFPLYTGTAGPPPEGVESWIPPAWSWVTTMAIP